MTANGTKTKPSAQGKTTGAIQRRAPQKASTIPIATKTVPNKITSKTTSLRIGQQPQAEPAQASPGKGNKQKVSVNLILKNQKNTHYLFAQLPKIQKTLNKRNNAKIQQNQTHGWPFDDLNKDALATMDALTKSLFVNSGNKLNDCYMAYQNHLHNAMKELGVSNPVPMLSGAIPQDNTAQREAFTEHAGELAPRHESNNIALLKMTGTFSNKNFKNIEKAHTEVMKQFVSETTNGNRRFPHHIFIRLEKEKEMLDKDFAQFKQQLSTVKQCQTCYDSYTDDLQPGKGFFIDTLVKKRIISEKTAQGLADAKFRNGVYTAEDRETLSNLQDSIKDFNAKLDVMTQAINKTTGKAVKAIIDQTTSYTEKYNLYYAAAGMLLHSHSIGPNGTGLFVQTSSNQVALDAKLAEGGYHKKRPERIAVFCGPSEQRPDLRSANFVTFDTLINEADAMYHMLEDCYTIFQRGPGRDNKAIEKRFSAAYSTYDEIGSELKAVDDNTTKFYTYLKNKNYTNKIQNFSSLQRDIHKEKATGNAFKTELQNSMKKTMKEVDELCLLGKENAANTKNQMDKLSKYVQTNIMPSSQRKSLEHAITRLANALDEQYGNYKDENGAIAALFNNLKVEFSCSFKKRQNMSARKDAWDLTLDQCKSLSPLEQAGASLTLEGVTYEKGKEITKNTGIQKLNSIECMMLKHIGYVETAMLHATVLARDCNNYNLLSHSNEYQNMQTIATQLAEGLSKSLNKMRSVLTEVVALKNEYAKQLISGAIQVRQGAPEQPVNASAMPEQAKEVSLGEIQGRQEPQTELHRNVPKQEKRVLCG